MGKMEASTMTENPVSYSHNSPESTSSEPDGSNIQEPLKKKLKTSESTISRKGEGEKLEERLNGILCCTVCLDLPVCTVYQCTNGHLMCAGCFTHLLADARLKDERATCPNCRCEISKNLCSRNLAVEKAVSELPIECPHCSEQLPRSAVDQHIWNQCQERLVNCEYEALGCSWSGPFHEMGPHEKECSVPAKKGAEVLQAVKVLETKHKEEVKNYRNILGLLSYEKITFNDLQLRPYRTDDFITKLYYESGRFSAFNQQWLIKTTVNDDERRPAHIIERRMTFQLVLKSRITSPMEVHYLVINGPNSDVKIDPQVYRFEFQEEKTESPYEILPLIDSAECNKILANKTINLRLILFQVPK